MMTRNSTKMSPSKKKNAKSPLAGKRRVRPEVEIEKLRKM
jgi:hypothetical protein